MAAIVACLAIPALAQTPPQGTPTRIRGAVEKLDGHTLAVKSRDGQVVTVALAPDVVVLALVKRTLADIKPGDFVASAGIKGTDGKIHAIEARILSQAMPGGGSQYAWDLGPDSVMTNATVGTVTKVADGVVLHVTFKDGQSEYTIGPDVPVMANTPGDIGLLKPGAAVFVLATTHGDGKITSNRLYAEKDGVKPPL